MTKTTPHQAISRLRGRVGLLNRMEVARRRRAMEVVQLRRGWHAWKACSGGWASWPWCLGGPVCGWSPGACATMWWC